MNGLDLPRALPRGGGLGTLFAALLASCASHADRTTFAGYQADGCKPGLAIELTYGGGQLVAGTFSLIDPEGLGKERLDYPMQILSRRDDCFVFRVDLRVGDGIQPFTYAVAISRQPDGSLHLWLGDQGASIVTPDAPPTIVLQPKR